MSITKFAFHPLTLHELILHLLSFDSILITSCIWCSPLQHSQQTTSCSFFSLFALWKEGTARHKKDNGSNYRATGLPDSITGLPDANLWLFLKQCKKKKNTRSLRFILYHRPLTASPHLYNPPRSLMEEGTVLQAGAFVCYPCQLED